jgi:UDP-glucose:(heptosyl)LPS alpha-1,3-glucosyltransferase
VLPTFYDPCSRFILEALAAGKPVITTRFNGASELFTNNRHGRVIDRPDNITALADALAHFTEPANIQRASQAIMEDNIKQKVSISRAAGQLKEVYDAILAKRRRR